ncbi:DUF3040 domain-containing protein [Demequina sp.]|uniref:DUF3040 domain-containing protein n=1 Tax=Demequina sp. TaxID=2050685 RepID=UPI003A8A7D51
MPLSEYEQRVLDQLEQDLGQDPSLHRAMTRGPRTPARVVIGVGGVLLGLCVILLGVMSQQVLVGIVGFVIMAGVALWALLAPRKKPVPSSPQAPRQAGPSKRQAPKEHKDFMKRMEERFERRRETGDF